MISLYYRPIQFFNNRVFSLTCLDTTLDNTFYTYFSLAGNLQNELITCYAVLVINAVLTKICHSGQLIHVFFPNGDNKFLYAISS